MYLTKIIQGLVASVRVCAAMHCMLDSDPLVYQTKIIQELVAGVRLCCSAMYVSGRSLVYLTKIIQELVEGVCV